MEYRVLGPLEAVDNGRRLNLGGARQQAVLASLLVHADQTVALERLVDDLWDEAPPETAQKTIQVYVSRLRKLLPDGAIERRPGGYALRLNGDRFDLRQFELYTEEGRSALAAGDRERAADLLRQALNLWRGPALAGLGSEALRREAGRLEELRLRTLEDRLEADLACGRHRDRVGELQALGSEQPLRQRLRAHLRLARYRSARAVAARPARPRPRTSGGCADRERQRAAKARATPAREAAPARSRRSRAVARGGARARRAAWAGAEPKAARHQPRVASSPWGAGIRG